MKNLFKLLPIFALFSIFIFSSCTTVPAGHKGVEVSWGGETNMDKVYPEGLNSGLHWWWDDMITYDVREHTIVKEFEFNDKNDMIVTVQVALDYSLTPDQVNLLHNKINDVQIKIETSLSSAAKEVVPQFTAVDLNKHKRDTAEHMLGKILATELPEFYVQFKRARITDVNIPAKISQVAEATAVQLQSNELALKKEAEQSALAKAKVAEAQGNFDAGVLNAKTQALLSQPQMLERQQIENERIKWEGFAKTGNSPYGSNNIFGGGDGVSIIRGLK